MPTKLLSHFNWFNNSSNSSSQRSPSPNASSDRSSGQHRSRNDFSLASTHILASTFYAHHNHQQHQEDPGSSSMSMNGGGMKVSSLPILCRPYPIMANGSSSNMAPEAGNSRSSDTDSPTDENGMNLEGETTITSNFGSSQPLDIKPANSLPDLSNLLFDTIEKECTLRRLRQQQQQFRHQHRANDPIANNHQERMNNDDDFSHSLPNELILFNQVKFGGDISGEPVAAASTIISSSSSAASAATVSDDDKSTANLNEIVATPTSTIGETSTTTMTGQQITTNANNANNNNIVSNEETLNNDSPSSNSSSMNVVHQEHDDKAQNGRSEATAEVPLPVPAEQKVRQRKHSAISASEVVEVANGGGGQPVVVVTRRKNSSMMPILPDLELMAQLQREDDERAAAAAKEKDEMKSDTGDGSSPPPPLLKANVELVEPESPRIIVTSDTNVDGQQEVTAVAGADVEEAKVDKLPLSQCDSFKEEGSEKESAAAWLAAATKVANGAGPVVNGSINNHHHRSSSPLPTSCNIQYKAALAAGGGNNGVPPANETFLAYNQMTYPFVSSAKLTPVTASAAAKPTTTSTPPPKLLQPFGKDDRVRRTSILRNTSPLVMSEACEKKNVRFADSLGHKLESVRYYVISPNQIRRRYSSNTQPTFITNFNSPWHVANYTSPLQTSTSLASLSKSLDDSNLLAPPAEAHHLPPHQQPPTAASTGKDFDFSHFRMGPRYELTPANFASPSLQYNFQARLDAQGVMLHSLTTAETTIYGIVVVKNLHFTKRVTVRYTFNEWRTYIEREATYMLGSHDGQTDKFSMVIYARPEDFTNAASVGSDTADKSSSPSSSPTPTSGSPVKSASGFVLNRTPVRSPRICFAIRYVTGDEREYWDSNDGKNYCLNLTTF